MTLSLVGLRVLCVSKTAFLKDIVVGLWLAWAWWNGVLEAFSEKSTGDYFYEGVDSVRGKFEEFVSMPSEGEIHYHRHGKDGGRAVRLVQAVPNSGGIWTCVLPSFTLTTVKLRACSAVTTRPISGMTYQGAPTLDAAAKTRARERSAQMIQGGIVAAELDAYKPMSGWRARIEKACEWSLPCRPLSCSSSPGGRRV